MAIIGRPPVKKLMIENSLRERIVSGELAPGARVPTRRALASLYDAMPNTIQDALASLERDGFVVAKGNRGTYVAPKPPHLSHFALVFPVQPDSSGWGLFWGHLSDVSRRVVKEQGLKLTIYTGIHKNDPGEDYETLLDDVRNDRLAGIIFPITPFGVKGTEVLEKPGIPRVVMGTPDPTHPTMGHVDMDNASFVAKAVSYLTEKGFKSVGLLQHPRNETCLLLAELEKAGIACPTHFQQAVGLDDVKWARNSMRLLFDAGRTARPEALMVLNDNLCLPALSGIIDAGLSVPHDLEILTHTNFPWQEEFLVPVTRLGFDMEALLRVFIEELERQREGQAPKNYMLPAIFEDEIET